MQYFFENLNFRSQFRETYSNKFDPHAEQTALVYFTAARNCKDEHEEKSKKMFFFFEQIILWYFSSISTTNKIKYM